MKQTKIKIIISEELQNAKAGVYKIRFSNGYFYIGCASDLSKRVKSHFDYINRGFSGTPSAPSLAFMSNFSKGTVIFELLEAVPEPETIGSNKLEHIRPVEDRYLNKSWRKKWLINKYTPTRLKEMEERAKRDAIIAKNKEKVCYHEPSSQLFPLLCEIKPPKKSGKPLRPCEAKIFARKGHSYMSMAASMQLPADKITLDYRYKKRPYL